jgi:hypothetical protein
MFAGFPFRAPLIVLKIAPVKRRSKRLVAHYWELREKKGSERVEVRSVLNSVQKKSRLPLSPVSLFLEQSTPWVRSVLT